MVQTKWVRAGSVTAKSQAPVGKSEGEGKPYVYPPKGIRYGQEEKKTSARKRRKDPDADRRGKAKNVKNLGEYAEYKCENVDIIVW